jgi:S1-C subfamily serine protease
MPPSLLWAVQLREQAESELAKRRAVVSAKPEQIDKDWPAAEKRRGRLGLTIQPLTDEDAKKFSVKPARGALVATVDDKGTARAAGIKQGNVVVKFDGKDVKDAEDLASLVAIATFGKEVEVVIVRNGAEQTRKLFWPRPAP